MDRLDEGTIRHALNIARQNGFRKVKLRIGESAFKATLGEVEDEPVFEGMIDDAIVSSIPKNDEFELVSPVVGYFRETPTPLEVGAAIKEGDVVASIVALGLANEVTAKSSGEVIEVHVKPGQPVEYGQALATVRRKNE